VLYWFPSGILLFLIVIFIMFALILFLSYALPRIYSTLPILLCSVGHGYGFGSGSSDLDPNPGKPAPAPAGSGVSTGCGSKVIRALGTHRQAPRYSLGHYCLVTTTCNWFILLEMEYIHLSGLYNYFFKLICRIQWYFVRNRHGVVVL
jgi:hypothetical protein